jgi:hypothetical protein
VEPDGRLKVVRVRYLQAVEDAVYALRLPLEVPVELVPGDLDYLVLVLVLQ